jgi:hypothetical protein
MGSLTRIPIWAIFFSWIFVSIPSTPASAVEIPKPVVVVPNIPRPTINVPRPNITVNVPKPNVTVNVPKPNITVNVPKPNATVNVPKPNVTGNVQKPNISVSVQKPSISGRALQSVNVGNSAPTLRSTTSPKVQSLAIEKSIGSNPSATASPVRASTASRTSATANPALPSTSLAEPAGAFSGVASKPDKPAPGTTPFSKMIQPAAASVSPNNNSSLAGGSNLNSASTANQSGGVSRQSALPEPRRGCDDSCPKGQLYVMPVGSTYCPAGGCVKQWTGSTMVDASASALSATGNNSAVNTVTTATTAPAGGTDRWQPGTSVTHSPDIGLDSPGSPSAVPTAAGRGGFYSPGEDRPITTWRPGDALPATPNTADFGSGDKPLGQNGIGSAASIGSSGGNLGDANRSGSSGGQQLPVAPPALSITPPPTPVGSPLAPSTPPPSSSDFPKATVVGSGATDPATSYVLSIRNGTTLLNPKDGSSDYYEKKGDAWFQTHYRPDSTQGTTQQVGFGATTDRGDPRNSGFYVYPILPNNAAGTPTMLPNNGMPKLEDTPYRGNR